MQFTARFWREFVQFIGSSQGLSSAYHPFTNGAAEWANAMVERYLWCYVSYQQTNWVDLLAFAEVVHNNVVHSSTGLSPFQVVLGYEFVPIPEYDQGKPLPCQPREWMEQMGEVWKTAKKALERAAVMTKKQADRKQKPLNLPRWGIWSICLPSIYGSRYQVGNLVPNS